MQVKSTRNATKRLETWRVLESFYKSGRCRAIGVSNYEQQHLQELLDSAAVKPMVNQVTHFCFQSLKLRLLVWTPFNIAFVILVP